MFAKLINDVVSVLGRRCRERKIINELESLSDRDLAELGIERTDIEQVARQALQKL
jgi:uncharacterized protein YjiS (DUF1127 family)